MSKSSDAPKSKLVKPENTLKKKVGHGGFDEATLNKAQHMIENNDVDFRPIATEFLELLGQVLTDIKSGAIKPEDAVNNIMYPSMQLKAQGTLFHYPLISKISHVLVDFLETIPLADPDIIEIVEAYKKSITAVVALQLKADNSKAGNDLTNALADACDRYNKAKAKAGGE